MADPAMAAGRAVDELTDEALPGLPMTSVDRIEADLLGEAGHEAQACYRGADAWPRCAVCSKVCVFDLITRQWRHHS